MRTPTKNHIELRDLEGYKGSVLLLSGHNKCNKQLSYAIEIDDEGVIYNNLILTHNGLPIDTPNNLPDAITKYNELI
jgi:hypothetical protein